MDLKALKFKAELNDRTLTKLSEYTRIKVGDYIEWQTGAFTNIDHDSEFVGMEKNAVTKLAVYRLDNTKSAYAYCPNCKYFGPGNDCQPDDEDYSKPCDAYEEKGEQLSMKCQRCGGLMSYEIFYGLDGQVMGMDKVGKFDGWRCISCGEVVDATILKNRQASPPPEPEPSEYADEELDGRKNPKSRNMRELEKIVRKIERAERRLERNAA
jgi:hypothetical protein